MEKIGKSLRVQSQITSHPIPCGWIIAVVTINRKQIDIENKNRNRLANVWALRHIKSFQVMFSISWIFLFHYSVLLITVICLPVFSCYTKERLPLFKNLPHQIVKKWYGTQPNWSLSIWYVLLYGCWQHLCVQRYHYSSLKLWKCVGMNRRKCISRRYWNQFWALTFDLSTWFHAMLAAIH